MSFSSALILLFVAVPLAIYLVVMLLSMRKMDEPEPMLIEEDKPQEPYKLYPKGPPRYTLDYRGRLWIDKKQKGLFRTVRRPNLPPDEPG